MQDILSTLQRLRRPRLLIRAARSGVAEYRRDLHLGRVLGGATPRRSGPALMRLIELEAQINEDREIQSASYSLTRHIEVLIAMMGEAHMLQPGS